MRGVWRVEGWGMKKWSSSLHRPWGRELFLYLPNLLDIKQIDKNNINKWNKLKVRHFVRALFTNISGISWNAFVWFAKLVYRIYSINRPGRLLNFWTLRGGAYSRWALIRGWALIKFSSFSASEVCLFCNKTMNDNSKTRRSNKARSAVKYSKENSVLGEVSYQNLFTQVGGVGVSASAYLSLIGRRRGLALIRGWALINLFCL